MDIGSALSSLSAAFGLAKSAVEARDEAKIKDATAEINEKLLALSTSAFSLIEKNSALARRINDLEAELAELQRKVSERENYSLYELAPGRFVYRFNPADDSGNPGHYVCQLCYDQGVKSVLRLHQPGPWGGRHYACDAIDKSTHDVYF